MIPDELRRIQQIMRLLQELKRLQEFLKGVRPESKEDEVEGWLREHRELFQGMSKQDLEQVREKADYDKDAWKRIVDELGFQ